MVTFLHLKHSGMEPQNTSDTAGKVVNQRFINFSLLLSEKIINSIRNCVIFV